MKASAPTQQPPKNTIPIPGVKHIVLVASGKGGVGKSTIATNLAISLSKQDLSVGLLDADIYGPSAPLMLGVVQKPEIKDNKIIPITAHGIQSISIGYLVDKNAAAAWRGPMISKTLFQLFRGVTWNEVDILIVDLPPGTGDVQLSIAAQYPIDGAVMVSTPQEVALADVKKAINLFHKVDVPIFGLIENMSYFEDPAGEKHYLFGKSGTQALSTEANIPLLGEIPIVQLIRESADNGTPFMLSAEGNVADIYNNIANSMRCSLTC